MNGAGYRVAFGRDALGCWAWMMLADDGAMIDSEWGFWSYEAAWMTADRARRSNRGDLARMAA